MTRKGKTSQVKLVTLFHRLGPYHHARLDALASSCSLVAVEFSSVDNTYAWDSVKTKTAYPVISLFTDADIDTKKVKEIFFQTKSTLTELAPHVVAIPGWSSSASLAALQWCCEGGTPAILMADSTAHDERRTWWKEWVKSRIVRLFSTALVAGKPHIGYVSALGLPRDRLFTGYDVVDNLYFSTQSEKARTISPALRAQHGLPEKYFLASNRFVEKKNLSRLVDAYAAYVAQAGEDAWRLVLLGDGPLRTAITDQVACLGLTEKVLLPGFRQYAELPIYYGLASAFIHSSTIEQWGLVVNEAMASGLPVLVSERCGCAPDLVQNGVNGFTFSPYDVKEMTRRMLRIGGEDCDLATMGQASRRIIRDWSPDTFSENMLRAAETALTTSRPRAGWLDRVLLSLLARR